MANNLRDIVRRHVEIETLKDFLGDEYDSAGEDKKERLLDVLRSRGEIDREVDHIIDVFYKEIEENSDKKSKRKNIRLIYSILSIAFTIGISFGVNKEYWVMTVILGLVNIVVIIWFMLYED